MHITNSSMSTKILDCHLRLVLPNADEHFQEKRIFTVLSVALNALACPVIVLLNVLVIVAVATRRALRNNTRYYVLLACLAGTDLLVGLAVQPLFIAAEVFVLTSDASSRDLCWVFDKLFLVLFAPVRASVYQLALLSTERYIAIKYSLRYSVIMTVGRVKLSQLLIWTFAVIPWILEPLNTQTDGAFRVFVLSSVGTSLFVILFCHVSVYHETRRHKKRIKTEQVSPEAAASFLKEKKALILTTIIIGCAVLSYFPGALYYLLRPHLPDNYLGKLAVLSSSLLYSSILMNSLYNPIIYCARSKDFRKAVMDLLKRRREAPQQG